MLNRPSTAVNKWAVVGVGTVLALVAILVISSLALNGIFAHDPLPKSGHDADDHIHYDENGMGPVRDFVSTDPEGSGIEWNVRGVDAADFEISSAGVLTFRESPDYENPTDRGLNLNPGAADNDFDDPDEFDPVNNEYQITVSATEMRAGPDAPLPAKRTDIVLTVIVGNVDDLGELTLQWLQPEVDTLITATLTDPDGGITGTSVWTWSTSKVGGIPDFTDESHWNAVIGEGLATVQTPTDANQNTVSSYNPQGDTVEKSDDSAVDEGKHLRVKVDYTDAHGQAKTVYGISMNPVRAEVSSPGDNGSPDFGEETDTRTVPESTAVGDPVGLPVTATDPDDDTVTYELIEVANPNNGDDEFFNIDMATGQITVAQNLDYDAVGDRTGGATDGEYKVSVRATDPSGLADNITVTIMAENVNEDPIVTGRAELRVAEGITGAAYGRLPDAPGIDQKPDPTNQRNEYVYEEPDHLDSIARWDLEGDDAGVFDHSGRFEPRYLQFKVPPDYENPTDMNRDNVYEVTLVATDTDPLGTGAGIGKVNVWLTVFNVNEEGEVVFTEGETAYLDEMLVAEVQDPDDHGGDMGEPYQGVHIVNWQWSRSQHDNEPTDDPFVNIVGATTNRYTARDSDRGYYLRATARYTDPLSADDNLATEADERVAVSEPPVATDSLRVEMATTENAVSIASGPENAPTFDEAGTVTSEVAEDTMPGGNVGAPVSAMAANTGETLNYTLEGTDAKYFDIGNEMDDKGQITVGGAEGMSSIDPELNYDDPMKKQRFNVTVKVKVMDGEANQNAEVDVVIIVTDVDEHPEITNADGEAAEAMVDYPENDEDGAPNTAAVATYVGTDPEEDTISWDLRGADAALFTIDGGVLKFRTAPDFENKRDVVGTGTATPDATADDNKYDIVIRAIASRASGDTGPTETVDTPVTVTVINVDEEGEVVISWLQPEVAISIMASLTDSDGGVTGTTWKWEVSEVAANLLDPVDDHHWGDAPGGGNTTESYTPDGANLDTSDDLIDEGKYLRVTATYTDTHGGDKMARAVSAYPVQARGGGDLNGSPDFLKDKVDRSVAETAAVGDPVDSPVTASLRSGGDASKDTLTYGLRAVNGDDLGSSGVTLPTGDGTGPGDDLAAFDIDKASGQIMVAQKLDFESRGDPNDGKYVVVVTVRDPSADLTVSPTTGYDFVVVVITAEDMNEDPVLSGRPELTINEINSGEANAANPEFDGNTAGLDPTVNVYGVVDEDHRSATDQWALEGEDAGQFQLIGTVGRTLVFRNQPDYETPADANGDNVYKVTVVTFDGDGGRGEFDVCIAVMNIDEVGKITMLDEDGNLLVQPWALGPITASLTDPDGGVTGVTWEWRRSQNDPPTVGEPTVIVPAATSDTYTPTNADTGFFLSVEAMYTDGAEEIIGGPRMAVVTAAHAVLELLDLKRPPAFPQDAIEVEVAENSPSTTYVGEAIVAAVDPDVGTTLIYTLVGDDAALFALVTREVDDGQNGTMSVNTRQIVVAQPLANDEESPNMWDKVDLDHEKKNSYEVELKASDGALDDTIMVTITVTDRNEAPSVPMEASGAVTTPTNNAPEFAAGEDGARSVAENTAAGENIGAPVMATDTDAGDTLTYTLGGADMASFDIDGATGQLMTKAALDFETKDSYTVEVMADDGNGGTDTTTVIITVTDVPEGSALDLYDADNSGEIEGPEVIQAVKDYFADTITGLQVIEVVKLYFAGRSN